MIWSRKDKNNKIYFCTADSMKFNTISEATHYLIIFSNYQRCIQLYAHFQKTLDRKDKLEDLIEKINQRCN